MIEYIKFLDSNNPCTQNCGQRNTDKERDEREKNWREQETIGDNRDNIVTRYRSGRGNESERCTVHSQMGPNACIRRRVLMQVNRIARQ